MAWFTNIVNHRLFYSPLLNQTLKAAVLDKKLLHRRTIECSHDKDPFLHSLHHVTGCDPRCRPWSYKRLYLSHRVQQYLIMAGSLLPAVVLATCYLSWTAVHAVSIHASDSPGRDKRQETLFVLNAQWLVNFLTKNLTCKIKVAEIIRIKSVVGRKGDPVFDHPRVGSRACNYFVEPSQVPQSTKATEATTNKWKSSSIPSLFTDFI